MTIGRLITPTLKLVREIGEGGMGTVWAAENLALGSLVAVKMLARGYVDEDKSIVRFRQEAQRAARVKSPHVATVFDHGVTAEGEPFIVMELLEGETLGERIKRNGTLPLDEIEMLVGQTAKALTAAHKLGVVHRDIKPANLFIVDNAGEPFVKVLDFGIAKQMDAPPDLTTTNTWLGSPTYMSPEQYMSPKQVDFRTDLWSLGVVVYEALTGKRPFMGETPIALAMAITKGRFKVPSEIRTDLPKALDEWMRRALAVEPEKRFESATKMAQAFKKALSSSDIVQKIRSENREPLTQAPTVRAPRQTHVTRSSDDATRVDAALHQPIVQSANADLRFFEGCWQGAPLLGHYYCRIILGKLYVAYCYNGNDHLSGEYYQCLVIERSLFGRFRWPRTPHLKGYAMMHATSYRTLVGGWWSESHVPEDVAKDLSKLNGAIPGMHEVAWRRMSPTPTFPDWVEAHFAKVKALAILGS